MRRAPSSTPTTTEARRSCTARTAISASSARPAGRKKTSAPAGRTDLAGATPEELADATRAVTCYAGRYELKDGEVHHHVEMALNPNMIGQTMIRRVHFDGPNLTLSARPDAQGQVRRIKWRRVETE